MRTRQQTRLINELSTARELDDGTEPSAGHKRVGLVDSTHGCPSQRKRRATGADPGPSGTKYANRIKGKLSGVLSLPTEMFMEILQYLALPDVFSLSRSNKFFHRMLMTRSEATLNIWRTAVNNVPGLPPCPVDLSEPQYATLIYSKHCTMCGASVVRPMDPYLNVRLCKSCIEDHVAYVNQIESGLRFLVHRSPITELQAGQHWVSTCLIRDIEEFEEWRDQYCNWAFGHDGVTEQMRRSEIEKRSSAIEARAEYAKKMKGFLRNEAEARTKQIEQLKERRREDVKRRLKEAGWEESDWTFPDFVARKWAPLVEAPQALTDRAWQKLYPSLVPYLEKNRRSHTERSQIVRQGKRLRRMRRLLLAIRNKNLFEVERVGFSAEQTTEYTGTTTTNSLTSSDENDSNIEDEDEYQSDSENSNLLAPIGSPIRIMMPFPPMVDLLKWPIISELLEADIDADTMQARFEELGDEIEDQIRSWASTVEAVLVNTLKTGSSPADSDDWNLDSEGPPLQLKYEIPPETPLMDRLAATATARVLFRADSVFRVSEDIVAPLPLYYPEIFPVLQARPNGYCTIAFQEFEYYRPKDGYTWDPSEVSHYPEGCAAAKELLRELGRVDAAQFELQALGARFTCGSCDDNWVRTWNEIVQHYAEAIAHANAVKKAKASVRKQVKYKNVHSFDKTKRKGKSLVIFHRIEGAKMLSSERREREKLVRCNLCEQLGVDFQSPRDVMHKHLRSTHSIKSPKAENYKRTPNTRSHTELSDPTGIVSDSTEGTDQEIADKIASRYSIYGTAAFWSYYGRHSMLHPGWNWRDF